MKRLVHVSRLQGDVWTDTPSIGWSSYVTKILTSTASFIAFAATERTLFPLTATFTIDNVFTRLPDGDFMSQGDTACGSAGCLSAYREQGGGYKAVLTNKFGTLVGDPFSVSPTTGGDPRVVAVGANFVVTWTAGGAAWGRTVTSTGTVGAEIMLGSSAADVRASTVGSHVLVSVQGGTTMGPWTYTLFDANLGASKSIASIVDPLVGTASIGAATLVVTRGEMLKAVRLDEQGTVLDAPVTIADDVSSVTLHNAALAATAADEVKVVYAVKDTTGEYSAELLRVVTVRSAL